MNKEDSNSQSIKLEDKAVLETAWKRTIDIGTVSTAQKEQYTALRKVAIALSLLTTFFAVISGLSDMLSLQQQFIVAMMVFVPTVAYMIGYIILFLFGSTKPILGEYHNDSLWSFMAFFISLVLFTLLVMTFMGHRTVNGVFTMTEQELTLVFRFIVLVLPILGTAVVLYARNFASSIWIDYRVQAEVIRSKIYEYRVLKGLVVDKKELEDARKNLLMTVETASEKLANLPNPIPYLQNESSKETLEQRIIQKSYDPKPFSDLSVDEYIEKRAINQMNWYAKRVERDHMDLQNYFIGAQGVAIIGAVLSGFDMVELVAITAAVTTALGLASDVSMYGATYGLFHLTAVRLDNAITEWKSFPSKEKAKIMLFISQVEEILSNEREAWEQQAKQLQAQAKQGIDSTNLEPTEGVLAQSSAQFETSSPNNVSTIKIDRSSSDTPPSDSRTASNT